MLILAFPRTGLYPLAWVALVPLLAALRRTRPVGSLVLGLVTGFIFFGGLLYWISLFGYLPCALLALVEAVSVAVFALLAGLSMRHGRFTILTVPAIWTAIEYLRSLGAFGLTWGDLAYSQARWLPIIQVSSITGPWGVTFLIVMLNTAIALAIIDFRKVRLQLAVAAGVVLVTAIGGAVSISITHHKIIPDKTVAMVQGGIEMRWRDDNLSEEIYKTYWPMTEKLGHGVDFIIWPESALPDYLLASPYLQNEMSVLARNSGADILAGGQDIKLDEHAASGYREYNGAYLISPKGKIIGEYHKTHLVPFGEFVPGRNWLPFINNYRVRDVDYSPGTGYHILHSQKGNIGVMICFESIFPQIGRMFAKNGANVLFVITNDSWFGNTAAAAQHHDFAVFRAVENRRYVARNATTGITSLISPSGEVIKSAGLGKKSVVQGKLAMISGKTIYTKYGDWFVWLSLAVGLIGLMRGSRKPDLPYTQMGHPR
ncbi:MAG: apolipoprotein N-acyltransferase [Armatimonadota bacterium]